MRIWLIWDTSDARIERKEKEEKLDHLFFLLFFCYLSIIISIFIFFFLLLSNRMNANFINRDCFMFRIFFLFCKKREFYFNKICIKYQFFKLFFLYATTNRNEIPNGKTLHLNSLRFWWKEALCNQLLLCLYIESCCQKQILYSQTQTKNLISRIFFFQLFNDVYTFW